MEKGQESKQKRKTPLTTIAISQEYAKKLDEYLNGTGITRKEFVELSVDYFQRTGFDLRGEAFDLSPLEKVAGRLEQSAKIMERHNEGTGSGAPASPSCPGTDRQATPSAGTDRPCCRRKSKGRSQKRRTRKGDCPAALRKLRFAGVQRKGIPGTMPDT